LKASVTVSQIFLKFLGASQLETLLTEVIQTTRFLIVGGDESTDSVAMVLGTISRDVAKHNLKKVGI